MFLECARALARRTLAEGGSNDPERLAFAFRSCLGARPTRTKPRCCRLARDSGRVSGEPAAALALATGNAPPADDRRGKHAAGRRGSWRLRQTAAAATDAASETLPPRCAPIRPGGTGGLDRDGPRAAEPGRNDYPAIDAASAPPARPALRRNVDHELPIASRPDTCRRHCWRGAGFCRSAALGWVAMALAELLGPASAARRRHGGGRSAGAEAGPFCRPRPRT